MGKWMSRLEASKSPDGDPAKTTKTLGTQSERVSVVSVALLTGNFQKSEGLQEAVQAQPQTALELPALWARRSVAPHR